MSTKNSRDKYKLGQTVIKVLPLAALAILFVIFVGVVHFKGYRLDMYLQIVFNESVVLAVVATGAIWGHLISVLEQQLFLRQPWALWHTTQQKV